MSVEVFHKSIKVQTKFYRNLRCDRCDKKMLFINCFRPAKESEHIQAIDALHVEISGGYGELIDISDGQEAADHRFILCKKCAMVSIPDWMLKALRLKGYHYADFPLTRNNTPSPSQYKKVLAIDWDRLAFVSKGGDKAYSDRIKAHAELYPVKTKGKTIDMAVAEYAANWKKLPRK